MKKLNKLIFFNVKIIVYLLDISNSSKRSAALGPATARRLLGPNGPDEGCGNGWWVFLWCTSLRSWCKECSNTWSWSVLDGNIVLGFPFVELWHKPIISWMPGNTCIRNILY